MSRRYAWMAMPTSGQSRNSGSVEDLAEDLQRHVLERVLLHVEVDERAVSPGQRAGSAAAGARTASAGAVRVDRVELAVQRRQLDRDVDARDRPAVVAVDRAASAGQALTSRAQALDQLEVLLLVRARPRPR